MLAQSGLGLPNLAAISGPVQAVEVPKVEVPRASRTLEADYGLRSGRMGGDQVILAWGQNRRK